jgi:O-antigen/teichoic acid export membrane protein
MKPLPLILGFLPLVAFSLLARLVPSHDFGIAALISAVVAVIAIAAHRPVWPPMILTGSQLTLLIILTIVGFAGALAPTGGWPPGWPRPSPASWGSSSWP